MNINMNDYNPLKRTSDQVDNPEIRDNKIRRVGETINADTSLIQLQQISNFNVNPNNNPDNNNIYNWLFQS